MTLRQAKVEPSEILSQTRSGEGAIYFRELRVALLNVDLAGLSGHDFDAMHGKCVNQFI